MSSGAYVRLSRPRFISGMVSASHSIDRRSISLPNSHAAENHIIVPDINIESTEHLLEIKNAALAQLEQLGYKQHEPVSEVQVIKSEPHERARMLESFALREPIRINKPPVIKQKSTGYAMDSVLVKPKSNPQTKPLPSQPNQQRSNVLQRQFLDQLAPTYNEREIENVPKLKLNTQSLLVTMALAVFVIGAGSSIFMVHQNRESAAKVAAISNQIDGGPTTTEGNGDKDPPPSTNKPSAVAYKNYVVGPDMPRYIKIPRLGVQARVLQVGVKKNGEMATPTNVFDTGWYTGSSKPGQGGATLIGGHVSSWSTNGVFYGIKNMKPGDSIQITRGDGAVMYYKVVKTKSYDANNVDMQAAVKSVTLGKSGLNLITCSGRVKAGTNEFSKRVIIFAEQV